MINVVYPFTRAGNLRTPAGSPGILYGSTTRYPYQDPLNEQVVPILRKLPDGEDLVAGKSAGRTTEHSINMRIVSIQADIPVGCVAILTIDGEERHATTDGQGNVGSVNIGDAAVGLGLPARIAQLFVRNDSADDLNIRYYLQGLAL